ncbi:MAG: hypothetical protein LBN71_02770 [Tannerella sp.]|nr:hypothetical protein [Tannerella sp.]
MGLIAEIPSNYMDINSARTIGMYVLFVGCLITVLFKRDKTLLFIGLYVGVMNFASFVLLQSSWAQDRLIMIYYPYILLFLLGGICYLFQLKMLRKAFFIYPILLIVLCVGTLSITKNRIGRNVPVLQQNILGDTFYGYTPDWENFMKASQWAAKNLDKNAVIASRKPTMSKVYTGRDFFGIQGAETAPMEELVSFFANKTEERTNVIADISKSTLNGEPIRYILNTRNQFSINGQATNALCVFAIPNDELETVIHLFEEHQMNYTFDCDDILKQCNTIGNYRIYNPEAMAQFLIANQIDYLLLAKLRTDPTQNTGLYINNVHRYIWYISLKYQDMFNTIQTIGKDETCEIVQFVH